MIGKTLAHYEITSQLGKGGMGEVYQAKDRKLGRDVAIKVLPEEFAKDTDRVSRFQREAKLLASLNHPNIAAIYGLEESGGTNFLVLELVEGQTLADRIKAGPIPVEESLKLALQIAEALEAAHEKGVIHRDLKPANIKVTPDGKVKVLDFGLAKAFAGEQADLNLSNSPTLSNAATQQGVILGTAAYMSPEQARGRTVDKKADIWAFGCVLYEMLTGRAAFSGKDVTDILAAVIRAEPEWSNLPANLHWRLREVIERCLQKEAQDRYHDISDVKSDIKRVLTDPGGVLVQPNASRERQWKRKLSLPWVAAAIVFAAIITGGTVWKFKPAEPHQVTRSEYNLPEGQEFGNLIFPNIAVSPDGRQFVYVTTKGLYLRHLDEFDARLIIGTEASPAYSFFSPDGKWVGYYSQADNKLKKIAISGGAPVPLCDTSALFVGGSWRTDDTIVYAEYLKGIERVSANGGTPEMIAKGALYHPQLLPDGKSVLFTLGSSPPYKILVQSLQSGERKELFTGDNARYIPTGHIVYTLGNDLLAVLFDVKTLKVTGGQVPLVKGISRATDQYPAQYAVSDSGTLVYIPGTTGAVPGQCTLVWVDHKGKEVPIAAAANEYGNPSISPDGTKVAFNINSLGQSDIWIYDLIRKTTTRLTFRGDASSSLWTLDGKRIAFNSGNNENSAVYSKSADGTGTEEKLSSEQMNPIPWAWSRDGKTLLITEYTTNAAKSYIDTLSLEGRHEQTPLLPEKCNEMYPKISPDGRWMAYTSDEFGKSEVYVRPFPEVNNGKWQVSTGGGEVPLWSPDGKELFYRNGDSVMSVAVATKPTFKVGKLEPLFQGKYSSQQWDIHPDGKRFLMMKEGAPHGGPRKINIVVNWFEELKQRVPVHVQ